ncbi:hypothetical protein [Pseudomonas sp. RC10]|uniref:hypothetical protein n=1 Tax=Pseudomonas bambusae TaxID=3139142 RepID=UPI003139762D
MNVFIAALAIAFLGGAITTSTLAAGNDATEAKMPIVLTLFLHDELNDEDIRNLDAKYLRWFTEDLGAMTERNVQIVPILRKPGYTDFDYRLGDADKALYEWDQRVIDYVIDENKPRDKRHKYLLITKDNLTLFVQGVAGLGKRSAIASMTAYRTLAHEVGHTLGATHSDGEFHATAAPAPCITNMFVEDVFFLKNCYRYSEKSAQAIRNYLQDIP